MSKIYTHKKKKTSKFGIKIYLFLHLQTTNYAKRINQPIHTANHAKKLGSHISFPKVVQVVYKNLIQKSAANKLLPTSIRIAPRFV